MDAITISITEPTPAPITILIDDKPRGEKGDQGESGADFSTLPDGALSIAKTSGLQIVLDGKASLPALNTWPQTQTFSGGAAFDSTVSFGSNLSFSYGANSAAAHRNALGAQPLDAALTALAAGSDFVQFTGPTTSTKVFTLPNANATLARTDAAQTFAGTQTFGGIVVASGGSASAPGYSFSGGSGNIGIFSNGTDQVAISIGGSERFRVTAYGYVLFSGSNMIIGSGNSIQWDLRNGVIYQPTDGVIGFWHNSQNVEKFRFDTANGNVGFGTTSPNAGAILDLSSTSKALLLPRMTKTQRNAIASLAAGMAVYQTDNTPGLRVYNGTNWIRFTETAD